MMVIFSRGGGGKKMQGESRFHPPSTCFSSSVLRYTVNMNKNMDEDDHSSVILVMGTTLIIIIISITIAMLIIICVLF